MSMPAVAKAVVCGLKQCMDATWAELQKQATEHALAMEVMQAQATGHALAMEVARAQIGAGGRCYRDAQTGDTGAGGSPDRQAPQVLLGRYRQHGR